MALVKYNNNSISAVTAAAAIPSGALTLIKTLTASSSATLSFVHGTADVVLDSTYPIYKFEFINCHPATDDVHLQFQGDTSSNTSYNTTITSTSFTAFHFENDSATNLTYNTNLDQAQATGFQIIKTGMGNDNDQSVSGLMYLFNPSSTTFVKHFMSDLHNVEYRDASFREFKAGYFNTTNAINKIQFKMSSGNIDAGKIKLYGIKDS
jgi:hypothetical protein